LRKQRFGKKDNQGMSFFKGSRKANFTVKPSNLSLVTTKDTHLDNIIASYLDETSVKLSSFEIKMKERIKTAFSLLLNWRSREQAANVLMEQFDVSQATAYRDISRALIIYGDINKAGKEGWRYIIMEYNHKLLQLATKEKNLEQMGRALDRMVKLADLDKDENLVNLEKLAAMDITVNISKSSEKAITGMLKGGVVDLNNFEAEDVEFEDVEDEDKK
jgi:hypothetical protein